MVDVIVLLRTSALSVKEVAAVAGYRETKALDRIFKGWFHMAPSAFRGAVVSGRSNMDARTAIGAFRILHPHARIAEIADETTTDFGLVARLAS